MKNYGRLDWLFYGIIAGILVNALFGIVQLAFYLRGDIFSLKPFFPDANISVPNNWNEFCTLGLFKEQGHLMRYLAIFAFPILSFARRKSKALFALMIFVIFIQMIMTASATLALFAVGCGIYLLILLLKKPKHGFLLLLIITVSFFLILFLSSIYSPVNKALQSLFNGLSDFSLSNGNSVRVLGITKGIELVKNYPIIGSGYNTVSMLFIENGYYGVDNVHGTYSAALSLIIELGIGCLPFFYFVLSKAFKLSLTKNKMGVALGVSLFIYLLVFLLTDYAFDGGSSVFIGIVLAFVKSQSSDGQRCGLHRKKANLFSGNSISQAI